MLCPWTRSVSCTAAANCFKWTFLCLRICGEGLILKRRSFVCFPTILHLCKSANGRWSCDLDWVQMDWCSLLISFWFLCYIISNRVDEKFMKSTLQQLILLYLLLRWRVMKYVVFSRLCFSGGLKHPHQFHCNDWPPTRLHQIRKVPFGRYCLLENYCCRPSAKLAPLKWSEAVGAGRRGVIAFSSGLFSVVDQQVSVRTPWLSCIKPGSRGRLSGTPEIVFHSSSAHFPHLVA